jgi:tellurite resistance protein TehA-like permease
MKNKILALLISLGCISLFLGLFMLLIMFPKMCWLYMGVSMLFLIYQGYAFWLQKLNRKNKQD